MFVKIATILLMAFIATSQGEEVWDGYSAKWAENPVDGFYHLPQRLEAAKCNGWTEIPGSKVPSSVKALGYRGDPRVILLFSNHTGRVIGHQIGFPVADVANVPINYTANPALTKQTLNGTGYYTGTALYRQDERTNTRRIWFLVNGKLVEIPTKPEQLSSKTPYFLKRCVTWMGLHYYQINSTTNCSNIFPFVPLRVKDDIIGINFQVIGTSSSGPHRKWFETLPESQLAYTIPDAPVCLIENLKTYGAISFHVWFKKNPLGITCSDECTAEYSPNYKTTKYYAQSGSSYNATGNSGNVCPIE